MGSLNRTLYGKSQHAHPGLQHVYAQFEFQGGDADADAAEGFPFAVDGSDLTNSAAGVFVLTVPGEGTLGLLSVDFSFLEDTDKLLCLLTGVSEANRTLTFTFYDAETAGTATSPPDAAKLFVHLVLKGREV